MLFAGVFHGNVSFGVENSGPREFSELRRIAAESLSHNIRVLKSGNYLSAGDKRFRSFWTRDFSFASRGLYQINRQDVIQDQLRLIFDGLRESDGAAPTGFGSVVDHGWLSFYYRIFPTHPVPHDPLICGYGGAAGGAQTMDSGVLALLAAFEYFSRTGDQVWWNDHLEQMVKAYRFYDRYRDADGLVVQGDYSDWQDSVKRNGRTSFLNLAYYAASERLARFPEFGIDPAALPAMKQKILEVFKDASSGLFVSVASAPYISLDANLLAIDWGFFQTESQEARDLYSSLTRHPLWTRNNLPGFVTYPNYPDKWVTKNVKRMGLRHYHDSLYWSWLMGLSGKVAWLMGDVETAERIFEALEKIAVRDQTISEIYEDHSPFERFHSFSVGSEKPFSWGAGIILDALAKVQHP